MEETKKLIDDAIAILSTLSVNGDAVEVMAAAKSKLRKASANLKEEPDGREEYQHAPGSGEHRQ